MAAPCVASEVAVTVKAENSITRPRGSSASLCAGVGAHFDCTLTDLILEAVPQAVSLVQKQMDADGSTARIK